MVASRRRALLLGALLLACLRVAPDARADAPPHDAGPAAASLGTSCVGASVDRLLDTAAGHDNTAPRREARSRLFREVVPFVEASGRFANEHDEAVFMRALGRYPCATAPLRLVEGRSCGRLAVVTVGGAQGGCKMLLGRFGGDWRLVMPLSWTISG